MSSHVTLGILWKETPCVIFSYSAYCLDCLCSDSTCRKWVTKQFSFMRRSVDIRAYISDVRLHLLTWTDRGALQTGASPKFFTTAVRILDCAFFYWCGTQAISFFIHTSVNHSGCINHSVTHMHERASWAKLCWVSHGLGPREQTLPQQFPFLTLNRHLRRECSGGGACLLTLVC